MKYSEKFIKNNQIMKNFRCILRSQNNWKLEGGKHINLYILHLNDRSISEKCSLSLRGRGGGCFETYSSEAVVSTVPKLKSAKTEIIFIDKSSLKKKTENITILDRYKQFLQVMWETYNTQGRGLHGPDFSVQARPEVKKKKFRPGPGPARKRN